MQFHSSREPPTFPHSCSSPSGGPRQGQRSREGRGSWPRAQVRPSSPRRVHQPWQRVQSAGRAGQRRKRKGHGEQGAGCFLGGGQAGGECARGCPHRPLANGRASVATAPAGRRLELVKHIRLRRAGQRLRGEVCTTARRSYIHRPEPTATPHPRMGSAASSARRGDQKGEGAASGDSRWARPQSNVTVCSRLLAALGSRRRPHTLSPTAGLVTARPSM